MPSYPNKLFPGNSEGCILPSNKDVVAQRGPRSSAGVGVYIEYTWFSSAWVKVLPHPVGNTNTTTGTGTEGLNGARVQTNTSTEDAWRTSS